MATAFEITRDINGYVAYGLKFTDVAYSCTLTASSDTTLVVPTISAIGGATFTGTSKPRLVAIFGYDANSSVWVANNHAASNPAGNTFVATNSELNPSAREVFGGDTLHFFSTGTSINVSVSFYWLNY